MLRPGYARPVSERTERLSASDMSSLLAERGAIHVNVGATLVLEGDRPTLEELLAHVESRLALVPRFRQRGQSPPLELTNPVWADDDRFDLRWHVRHTALPRPARCPSFASSLVACSRRRSTSSGHCGSST